MIVYLVTVTDLYGCKRTIEIELRDGATTRAMQDAITEHVGRDWWSAEWTSQIRDPKHTTDTGGSR